MNYQRPHVATAESPLNSMSESTARQIKPIVEISEIETQSPASEAKVSYWSLPNKGQLALMCIARMADPLAITSMQTYMFFQLRFFDSSASAATISSQAGIIVGARTAAQVCTGMLWGRVADSEYGGRKTVLMVGLLSSGIACVGYGFSKTFIEAVLWQVFAGAMSSNVGITRCVVAELNPEKRYRTRALLLLPLFASAGMLIGPLVGGFLSFNPGEGPLKAYPYALPNVFGGTVYAVAALGVFFGVEETLEGFHHEGSYARRLWRKIGSIKLRSTSEAHAYSSISTSEREECLYPIEDLSSPQSSVSRSPVILKAKPKRRLPFLRIWTPNVLCTMLAHFIIAGHLATFTNLWAIFLSTPVGNPDNQRPPFRFNGGTGMHPREVGVAMSSLGAIGVILQMVIYPKLNDRWGTVQIWRNALFVFPCVYVLAPFLSLVASARIDGDKTVLIWLAMGFIILLFVIGRTGVTPATTLLINDCTPHPSVRGTIHTAGTTIGNISRSFFPVIAFFIFGKGLEIGIVGLGFWCVAGLSVLACVASFWVREGSNGQDIVLEDEDEDEEVESETGAVVWK